MMKNIVNNRSRLLITTISGQFCHRNLIFGTGATLHILPIHAIQMHSDVRTTAVKLAILRENWKILAETDVNERDIFIKDFNKVSPILFGVISA